MIALSSLPDSAQPKTIFLKNAPKPQTIRIPHAKGGSFAGLASNGTTRKISLEPPEIHVAPVFKDEKGDIVKDRNGHSFTLGDGGISNFTTYTTDDGLALDAISSSCIDHFGNIWFGTNGGGASRYDGKSFTNFTTTQGLTSNNVYSIFEDKKGNLWLGTFGGGVSRYDGRSFTTFTTTQGLAGNNVLSITEDKKGNLWFGTFGGGASRYDGKSFTNFSTGQGLASNNLYCIEEDKNGNLWFGTDGGGVSRYDGRSFVTFTTKQGLADNTIRCICADKAGNTWFGTEGGGVSRYDGKSFTTFTTSQGLANNTVRSIAEDREGNIWFGTDNGGISRYDGKSFVTFTISQGLSDDTVRSITEDHGGNIWFGTDGGGVSRYNGKSFVIYTASQGLANNTVRSIAEDKNGYHWFATDGGISRYDGHSFTTFTVNQGLASNYVWSILEDKNGNLWFGTEEGGVSRYDGQSFTTFTTEQGLTNNTVWSIATDAAGNLWFGTDGGGVSRFDGQSFTTYTTDQGLTNNTVKCILVDRDQNLWFGTEGNGVSRFDGKTFTNYTTSQGLVNNNIVCITEDNAGNLWFGTEGGGISLLTAQNKRFNPQAATPASLFKNFITDDGLPDNFATQIVEANDSMLYIGTNYGICELFRNTTGWKVGRVFNSATGFPVKDVNVGQNTLFKDSQSAIWIATGSDKTALVRFDPKTVRKSPHPPRTIIQRVRVGEAAVNWYGVSNANHAGAPADSATVVQQEIMTFGKLISDRERDSLHRKYAGVRFDSIPAFYPLPVNLQLPYWNNSVSIDFVAVETGVNFLVRYQYILEGYSRDWSPVTDKTSAIFGNINEGEYTFSLKARSPEGIWSEPVTYRFTVLPPWWRTWWAYVLYLLFFMWALRIFSKYRERALLERQKMLEETVEIRTAEVVAEKHALEKEKQRSDELLLNILPEEVAEELKLKGSAAARQFESVTVMFTDFKGFTQMAEKLTPAELVAEIDECFKAFDHIITKYDIEKIKTIGDSYMCAGGLPVANLTNATDIVNAALEIQAFILQHGEQRKKTGKEPFEIRIGIHTGPVVAGIVGIKKFAYDIWGDTVNIASRMESSGEPGKVNISGSTYELVKDRFDCVYRGKVQAKHKGEIDMYFVGRPIR